MPKLLLRQPRRHGARGGTCGKTMPTAAQQPPLLLSVGALQAALCQRAQSQRRAKQHHGAFPFNGSPPRKHEGARGCQTALPGGEHSLKRPHMCPKPPRRRARHATIPTFSVPQHLAGPTGPRLGCCPCPSSGGASCRTYGTSGSSASSMRPWLPGTSPPAPASPPRPCSASTPPAGPCRSSHP